MQRKWTTVEEGLKRAWNPSSRREELLWTQTNVTEVGVLILARLIQP